MSPSNEVREDLERYYESRELSQKTEEDLREKMAKGRDFYSDLVLCPNNKCRNQLKIDFHEDFWELFCSNCGFNQRIFKKETV